MAPVFFPVTENATIQHILEISQKATENVGQQFTIVTFDSGAAQKAYNIVWQNHVKLVVLSYALVFSIQFAHCLEHWVNVCREAVLKIL